MAPLSWFEIFGQMFVQFMPVWIALVIIFLLSVLFKRKLGLYGRLFDSPIGMIGLFIVLFWVLTAIFADMIITHDPLAQVSGMKNKIPGTPVRGQENAFYLLGGDNLARDIFSRMVMGARFVLSIAPAATLFAFMVGITLGLPAGYFGKRLDTILSFLANMVLAFPVILLFYLLVTPEIRVTGIPMILAAFLFLFPIVFLMMLFHSRYYTEPAKRNLYCGITLIFCLGGLTFLSNWIFIANIYLKSKPIEVDSIPRLFKILFFNLLVSIIGVLAMGVLFVSALMISHG